MTSITTDRLIGVNASPAVKSPCRVATTAPITLSGLKTVDGVLLEENDRVMVKDQVDPVENGIWVVSESAWRRAKDFDGARDVVKGTLLFVNEGTLGNGLAWRVWTPDPVRIGQDDIVFSTAINPGDIEAALGPIQAQLNVIETEVDLANDRLFNDVKLFGAASNDVSDDTVAVMAANAAGAFAFVKGVTRIVGGLTLSSPVKVYQGAQIKVDGGTLVINGSFNADLFRVFWFANGGNVQFGPLACEDAHPEWWGAVANNPAVDSTVAINRALQSHTNVRLLPGTYYITNSIINNRSGVSLSGTGPNFEQSVLSINSPTIDAVIVGKPTGHTPGDLSTYLLNQAVSNVKVVRSVAPTFPATNDPFGFGVAGKAFLFIATIRPRIDRCNSLNSIVGFQFALTVNVTAEYCVVDFGIAGSAGNGACGFLFDGYTGNTTDGQISPNASSYLRRCITSSGPFAGTYIGFLISGRISDQFLDNCENAGATYGFLVEGPGAYGLPATRQLVDVHLINPVSDGVKGSGIYIRNTIPYGAINIVGGYTAPTAGNSSPMVHLDYARGVKISPPHQFIGHPSSVSLGLYVHNSDMCEAAGTWQDCARPIVSENSRLGDYTGTINNGSAPTGAIGVELIGGSSRNKVAVMVSGENAGQFAAGVRIDVSSGLNEVNCTRINPSAGVTNKLVYIGTPVVAPGTFGGGNLASGVMN